MCDPTAEPDVGSPLVFVGVAMSAVATIAGNAGLNMQKWGFLIEAKKPAKERVHFVKMWKWWAGFVLVVVGAIMDFVSYGLAPSSIVTPVGSLTLVVNIFLAHWWLGENIYMQDYVGTFFIVAGATMTVVFGNQSDSCLPVSELAARYATTGMIVYMACAVAIVAAISGTGPAPPGDGPDSKLGVLVQSGSAASGERSAADAGTGAGAGASSAAPEAKDAAGDSSSEEGSPAASPTSSQHVVDPPSAYEPYAQWHPVSVSVLAGTLGAQTVLFAKSVAETIKTTAGGDSQLDQPAPYLFLLALVFFIVVQQMWLAHALRFFDAAFVVPVFQGTYIAVSVLGGVAYFQELNGLSTVNLIMFPISVLVVLFGVYVLSTRKMGGMRAQLFKDADEEEDAKSDARTGAGTSSPATPALSAPAASTARKPAGPAPAVPKLGS
ncbi:hypothetical protein FNF28_00147 [Cafeteria roenbergensis]|uniref:Magnesium transporter n=1 Tax=Cafeteria roenbergensis TaxID=33653 RepID=A0A5A8E530_CAFRO|nr:hypothetical protein FNF28_00147 [Cafeteria roenbergensis]